MSVGDPAAKRQLSFGSSAGGQTGAMAGSVGDR